MVPKDPQAEGTRDDDGFTTLRHWPYAVHRLFESPTDKLIEDHAISLLCRALAMGRVTAFVGSGVSIAYGRLSWSSLIEEIKTKVLLCHSDGNYKNPDLVDAIKAVSPDDAANQLTLYQLTRQLYEQCPCPDEGRLTFHKLVGELIKDDVGHLRALSRRFSQSNAGAIPDDVYSRLSSYDLRTLTAMGVHKRADWAPQKRYRILKEKKGIPADAASIGESAPAPAPAPALAKVPRAERYISDFDPLKILIEDLKIQRFLTTNYDAEIQKAFDDQGYFPNPHQGKGAEILGKGSLPFSPTSYSELIFSKENAAELMVLAALRRPQASWVLHLHGKAGDDSAQSIIATETDYLARYVHDDKRRFITESAVRQAFGSSPLFFVGIGLGEEDLMRPLREFMSRRPYPVDRAVIAALPRTASPSSVLYKKIKHLQNHGVYVVHYGSASFKGADGTLFVRPNWLYSISEIIKKLRDVVKIFVRGRLPANDAISTNLHERLNYIADCASRLSEDNKKFDLYGRLLVVPEKVEEVVLSKAALETLREDIDEINGVYWVLRVIYYQCLDGRGAGCGDKLDGVDAALGSILDNLYTLSCTAFLRRLHGVELPKWRDRWLKEINFVRGSASAEPKRLILESTEAGFDLLVKTRHIHEKDIKNKILAPRFSTEILSQTWYRFLSAIRSERRLQISGAGRRTFFLAANRGLGKGQIFAEFTSRAALASLLHALGVESGSAYAGLFSFSFSNELISVFDKILELLSDAARLTIRPDEKNKFNNELNKLGAYRDAKLRLVMEHLSGKLRDAKGAPFRILLILNSASILFDADGAPKNRQIRNFLEILFSKKFADVPLDIILITGSRLVPRIAIPEGGNGVRLLTTPGALGRELQANEKKIKAVGLSVVEQGSCGEYLHFLGSPRVSIIVASDFPIFGFAVALAVLEDAGSMMQFKSFGVIACEIACFVRAAMMAYDRSQGAAGVDWIGRKKKVPEIILSCTRRVLIGQAARPANNLNENENELLRSIDDIFKGLYRAVGRSRYGLTILLSSLEENFILKCLREARVSGVQDIQAIAREVVRDVNAIKSDLQFQAPDRRDDQIVRLVWEHYRRAEQEFAGCLADGIELILKLSAGAKAAQEFTAVAADCPNFVANLVKVQLELTWHMAVIGQPVEASVLAVCPDVSSLIAGLRGVGNRQHNALVEQALRVMVSRGLAFTIEPARSSSGAPLPIRYGVHRFVQRRIFHEMGARYVEYSEVGKLTLSSYASQPNDVPVLTADAHRKVKGTIGALVGYPPGMGMTSVEAEADQVDMAAQGTARIRAAFGMVKTVYSVACIAKLDIRHVDSKSISNEANIKPAGLFEEHRQLLLWLLGVVDSVAADQVKRGADAGRWRVGPDAPLYADELVWLYNECGVLSLAQGRSPDARALFRLADRAALRVDEASDSSTRTLIKLNIASAEIGRGRLAEAEIQLKDVLSALDQKFDGEHYQIARGYLCVIDQLRGHDADLLQRYPEIIDELTRMGALRAASTFSRNFAILRSYRARHTGNKPSTVGSTADDLRRDAILMAEQAVRLAAENGHEDVRQLGLITCISMRIQFDDTVSGDEVYRALEAAEHYADAMGIPHLECACAYTRAEFHLKNGDYPTAFKAASYSVELATLYDLELRKVAGLKMLAKIALKGGFARDAGIFARGALTLIDSIGFYAESVSVKDILDKISAVPG